MRTEDGHIIYQCLEGDSTAFGLLVDKYKASIFALAYSKLGNFHDAEDVTQEVFIKAFKKLKTLKHRDNFLAWIYAITSNLCKNWIKAREIRLNHEINEKENSIDHPSAQYYHDNEIYESLYEALELLPESYKQVLILYYLGGMDGKEIAKFLGTSQNAIMLRLSRARSQLREEMVTMMRGTYETQRLPVSFTFRIVEIIKRISLHSQPSAPWISWGATLTAGIIFTILSLSSPQTSFSPLKAFSELSSRIGTMGAELYPVINQQNYRASMNAEIPVEPLMGSKGLKGNALAGSGKGDESKTETPSQTNVPAVTGNVEMQTVSGKILRDDNPVPNAQVYVYNRDTQARYEGISGKDGTFMVEVPKPDDDSKWGRLIAIAIIPEYSFNWSFLSKNKTSDIILKMYKPLLTSGSVVDSAGNPVVSANISINWLVFTNSPTGPTLNTAALPSSIATVETDSDGKFVFQCLPEELNMKMDVVGSGYAKETRMDIKSGNEDIIFILKPEARIEGRMTFGDTGKPAKGVRLYASPIYPSNQIDPGNPIEEAITDDNGHYALTNLLAGSYDVVLDVENKEWTALVKEHIKAEEGETVKNIDLQLIKGGIVNGRVLDQDTNEPLKNVSVQLNDRARPLGQRMYQSTVTDKDGKFQFRVAPGRANLIIQDSPQGYELADPMWKYYNVAEGQTISDVNILLRKSGQFSAKISLFTLDGDPVADALIIDAQQWFKHYGVSDQNGKFIIPGVIKGQKLSLRAEQSKLKLRGSIEIDAQPDQEIEIIMQKYETASVTGRVINEKGEPVSSAKVDFMQFEGNTGREVDNDDVYTDSSGNYKIDLAAGIEYYIISKADGYKQNMTKQFKATKGVKPMPDIVLQRAGKFYVEGIVKDTNGNPVPGARIDATSVVSNTITDYDGSFRLENLPNYVEPVIYVNHPDYGTSMFRFVPTNSKQDFVIVKADGFLAGKIVDSSGNPVQGVMVNIDLASDSVSGHINSNGHTDSQGYFRMDYLLVNKKENLYIQKEFYAQGESSGYRRFKDVEMNRDDLILTFTDEPSPEPTPPPEQKQYYDKLSKRYKEIEGKTAPQLSIEEWVNGKPLDISKLKGKIVVLQFWSMENQLSVESIRLINMLQKLFDKDVVFIGIHEYTANVDKIKNLVKENNATYNIGIDKKSPEKWAKGETFDRYARVWYTYTLIDRKGSIKYINMYDQDLENKIQQMISD